MKREIYTFTGKDYESGQIVEFTFLVHRNCIENFLTRIVKSRKFQGSPRFQFSGYQIIYGTSKSFEGKTLTGRFYAYHLYRIMRELGVNDHNEVRDNFVIYQHKLLKIRHR